MVHTPAMSWPDTVPRPGTGQGTVTTQSGQGLYHAQDSPSVPHCTRVSPAAVHKVPSKAQ